MGKDEDDWDIEAHLVEQFGEKCAYQCEIHGEYSGYERLDICSTCVDEETKREAVEQAKKRHLALLAERWERSGMTKKFCGVEMGDWIATNEKQQAAKRLVRLFVSGDLKRLMIVGNCGVGKTMLAAAAIGEMALAGVNPMYITATRLVRDVRDSWKQSGVLEQSIMNKFILADVLVVDELGAGRCSEDDKLMLSEIVCDRYANELPTMLISNLSAQEIKEKVLDERAYDRMRENGRLAVLKGESERVKSSGIRQQE